MVSDVAVPSAIHRPHEWSAPAGKRAVALFGGAGGSSRGLEDAGHEVVAFDNWQPAVDTHNANGMLAHLHDLSDPSIDDLIPECDLMWISCPCQPFSAAGDGDGEFDDRDGFPWALRIVALRLPPVVIFENVKGLTFDKHRGYLGGILKQLHDLGYGWQLRVLNCADFGVPQTRERTIIVARRDDEPVEWPMPTHTEKPGMFTAPWVSMGDALGWNAPGWVLRGTQNSDGGDRIERGLDEPAMTVNTNCDRLQLRYKLDRGASAATGALMLDPRTTPAPTVTATAGAKTPWWWRQRPSTTINGDPRVSAPGHHDPTISGSQQADAIRLEIHELARLQDFPDDWTWTGTKTDQSRQIGNAVPPTLARVVAAVNQPRILAPEVAA